YYENVITAGHVKASECIKCGGCERVCPQHLEIRSLLDKVAATFEG
ncbi:MAG: 4Fe-4S dicluster domain-containing protein, partial [Oscillospiraceae bacterium]|nr:4Fe-4S dicluster domain-containing protein [Oscillospiraceae bacterium]